jgi:hypothetical protein
MLIAEHPANDKTEVSAATPRTLNRVDPLLNLLILFPSSFLMAPLSCAYWCNQVIVQTRDTDELLVYGVDLSDCRRMAAAPKRMHPICSPA